MHLTAKDYFLIALVFIMVVVLFTKTMSFADTLTPLKPGSCNPTPIDVKLACKTVYPNYPNVGDIAPGGKKFCCAPKV